MLTSYDKMALALVKRSKPKEDGKYRIAPKIYKAIFKDATDGLFIFSDAEDDYKFATLTNDAIVLLKWVI
jgi:hypothetical protein